MSHKLVILTAVAVFNSTIVLGLTYFDVNHFDPLDGKRCTSPLFTIVAQSKIACATRCARETSCKSHFFTPGTRKCIGCGSVYHASDLAMLEDELGSLYYRPYVGTPQVHYLKWKTNVALYNQICSPNEKPCLDDNTVCFNGINTCVCGPFFVYDPSTETCTNDCSTLGETFQMYPKHYVVLNDGLFQMFQYNVATCLSYCTQITAFTCYGVDYDYASKICSYSNAKLSTVSSAWTYSPSQFNAYIRNCA